MLIGNYYFNLFDFYKIVFLHINALLIAKEKYPRKSHAFLNSLDSALFNNAFIEIKQKKAMFARNDRL
jgi:hypothetical protein